MVGMLRKLDLNDLCVHQVCLSGQCDFSTSLAVLGKSGINRTALWNPMIDSVGEAAAFADWQASGLIAESLCAANLFCGPDQLKLMLERADRFGARTLVLITGGLDDAKASGLADAREKLVAMLAEADGLARPYNVQLAFEPLHPMVCGMRSVVSSLAEALSLLDRLDSTHDVGLAIDSYALWWEHDLAAKLVQAGPLIRNYHVSDWLADTQDLRLDRGMPGDGQIDLLGWRRMMELAGYTGPIEIEIFSQSHWWKTPPESMVQAIINGMNSVY